MKEDKEKGSGDILGSLLGSTMGATAPMLTGLIKSVLSPGMIKSVVGIVPDLLGAVVDALSSINMKETISPIVGSILFRVAYLLSEVLRFMDPLVAGIVDMLDPLLEPALPILKFAGRILDPLIDAVTPMLRALLDILNRVFRLFPYSYPEGMLN